MAAPKALTVCNKPGCGELTPSGRCETHRREAEQARGTFRQRGYGSTWDRKRAAYLHRNPSCTICGSPATVADHYPLSRRDLVAQHDPDPDGDHHLRPLCIPCHSRETALHQPGGFNTG